ncbi:BQ5605_C002g01735 [Microbotryum silenes-dioicae]|uniref:BQ5605_C002g01735 protein n=1 Tax=Microbotryum silenes-dioicae TaxID=796604 RepID=A0A2X0MLK0_9BASI|nr:BQ5605_C002g01735 [Microbotryum silenes-dioicae]
MTHKPPLGAAHITNMDLAPLPAPLHLRPLRIRSVPTPFAIVEVQRFLADETANRVLSGAGASAIKEALVRLVKRLEQEQSEESASSATKVDTSSISEKEKDEGKKRKVIESELTKDKKQSKKHKKA